MANSFWKTKASSETQTEVLWPSRSQILRQLGLIVLILIVWSGIFLGYLAYNNPSPPEVADQASDRPETAQNSDNTPTPTTAPSLTPIIAEADESITDTALSAVQPTDTPTPPATATPEAPPATASGETVSFQADVQPILQRRCVKCHGSERVEEGLQLETYEQVILGSWGGEILIPGDAEGSYMVELIRAGDMPQNEPRLLPNEIRGIETWINSGAPNN